MSAIPVSSRAEHSPIQNDAIGAVRAYRICILSDACHPVFVDWRLARATIKSLNNPLIWRGSRLLCWVLLPDRLHALIMLGEMDSLSSLIGRVKAVTAHAVDAECGARQRLWTAQECRLLPIDTDLVALARDLVREPLRLGLVVQLGQYPHWDAIWLDSHA